MWDCSHGWEGLHTSLLLRIAILRGCLVFRAIALYGVVGTEQGDSTHCKPSLGYAKRRTHCCNVVWSYAYHTNIKSWATCVGLDHMVVLLLYCCGLCYDCKQALAQDCKLEHAMNNNSRIITMRATKHYMTTMTSHCVMWATKVGWHLAHVPQTL